MSALAQHRAGLLRGVGGVFADEHMLAVECKSRSLRDRGEAQLRLSLEIRDLETLSRALSRIEALPFVLSAKRIF